MIIKQPPDYPPPAKVIPQFTDDWAHNRAELEACTKKAIEIGGVVEVQPGEMYIDEPEQGNSDQRTHERPRLARYSESKPMAVEVDAAALPVSSGRTARVALLSCFEVVMTKEQTLRWIAVRDRLPGRNLQQVLVAFLCPPHANLYLRVTNYLHEAYGHVYQQWGSLGPAGSYTIEYWAEVAAPDRLPDEPPAERVVTCPACLLGFRVPAENLNLQAELAALKSPENQKRLDEAIEQMVRKELGPGK